MVENIVFTNKAISKRAYTAYILPVFTKFQAWKQVLVQLHYPKYKSISRIQEKQFQKLFLQMLG